MDNPSHILDLIIRVGTYLILHQITDKTILHFNKLPLKIVPKKSLLKL